jgi:hypothetical protein
VKWLLAQRSLLQLELASFHCWMLGSINDLLRRCALTIQTLVIPGELINLHYEGMCLSSSQRKEATAANTSADLSLCTFLRQLKLHHSKAASVLQVLRTVKHPSLRFLDLSAR